MNQADKQNLDSLAALIRAGARFLAVKGAGLDPDLREWEDQADGRIVEFFGAASEIAQRLQANAAAIRNPAGGPQTPSDRLDARFNMVNWTLRCLTFMKAEVEVFGPRLEADRAAATALANWNFKPQSDDTAVVPLENVLGVQSPEARFEHGVLHLSELWCFDVLDILQFDAGKPAHLRPIVTQGRIEGGTFSCPVVDSVGENVRPLDFVIRLASPAAGAMYFRVSVTQGSDGRTICTVTRE